jgi:hypothetical protein
MNRRVVLFCLGVAAGFVMAQVVPRPTYAQGTVTAHHMVRALSGAITDTPLGSPLQGARVATCFTYGSDGIFCLAGGQ